ncbi:MAG: methyltransferase [Chloroflexi bacterium]|nr:methyltransferase [Chloroflexota bacterium]
MTQSWLRPVWRLLLAWRFRLFDRHRHRRFAVEWIDGVPLVVLPDVFNPKLFRSGELLARYLAGPGAEPGASVLDLGTGSGVIAIFAGRWARRVVAVDLNPAAVRCARANVLLAGLESIVEVRHGDLFEPVAGERFDLVVFNPPYFRGRPRDDWDLSWRSDDIAERFAAGLAGVLTSSGSALVILSTDADPSILPTIERHGFRAGVVCRHRFVNETFTIHRLFGQMPLIRQE